MEFLNRSTSLGLNILQLMYLNKKTKVRWTSAELAAHLVDSELFIYKISKYLRDGGYIYSSRGIDGGYTLHPDTGTRNLKEFMEMFNKYYTPSSILNTARASEYANQIVTKLLYSTKLGELFEGKKPVPFMSIGPFPPNGAA